MPFGCKFCQGRFCAAHRLPESHNCRGLDVYRQKLRAEGRIMANEPDIVRPRMSASSSVGARFDVLFERLQGKMTLTLVIAMVAVFVAQLAVLATAGERLHNQIFILDHNFLTRPWTLLTSMFAHDPRGIFHILINVFVLWTFGTTLERLLGTRRFTALFLIAGLGAGLTQVLVINTLFGFEGGSLGASGAIMGLLGALTIIAPNITIMIMFVIPMPLWLATTLFALIDVWGAFADLARPAATAVGGVAHFAHLGGLAMGLAYGQRLKAQGVRLQQQAPPRGPMWGRG